MRRVAALAALWLVAAAPVPLTIDAGTVGRPDSDATAELFPIAGSGPFPAMVVLHSFDAMRPTRVYLGHHLGYDPAATADSLTRTKAFLDEKLKQ